MRFTIVHAADLHLDSPLVGLERYEGAPVRELRGATRRALENLIELCIREEAKLLLIAGDLYDGDWRDYSTGLFFASQIARLREVGTQVVWIRGNHDAQSKVTRHLALPAHCIELSTRRPETRRFDELGLAVHGQGFEKAAVSEDLAASYPAPLRGYLNIGLLHTALSGRRGHASYAPCDIRSLSARGYDYWALGHVHQREVVASEPWIVFPGNLQARHVRETGEKGATVLRVCDGVIERVEARALDVVRFEQLTVDASLASTRSDVAELVTRELARALERSEGRLLCSRIEVRGRSPAHSELLLDRERSTSEVKSRAGELGEVWVESVRFRTELPADLRALEGRDDGTGQLVRALAGLAEDPEAHALLQSELRELERTLHHELRLESLGIDLSDDASTRELLSDVSRLLMPRVLGQS